jgi:hypothetical protein
VANPDRSSGVRKIGSRFHVPVYFGIVVGGFLIAAVEVLSGAHLIAADVKDAGLVLGGALVGLIALILDDAYRSGPQRERVEQERDAERQRHQEERRLDFDQYRAVQSELRETRTRATALQAKLDLAGALDRDRVGDALLVGFYFHRRNERLPSSPKDPIFQIAGRRLRLLTEKSPEVKLEKSAVREILEISYGPVVSEAFDLGYVLSHLGEDGVPATSSPEILAELRTHLSALKLNGQASSISMSARASRLFRKLSDGVISIVRRP